MPVFFSLSEMTDIFKIRPKVKMLSAQIVFKTSAPAPSEQAVWEEVIAMSIIDFNKCRVLALYVVKCLTQKYLRDAIVLVPPIELAL